jgi:hypothetical protein
MVGSPLLGIFGVTPWMAAKSQAADAPAVGTLLGTTRSATRGSYGNLGPRFRRTTGELNCACCLRDRALARRLAAASRFARHSGLQVGHGAGALS